MNLINRFFSKPEAASATVARERLLVSVGHDRASRNAPDFLPVLQREILAVLSKYVDVDAEMIKVTHDKGQNRSLLEIDVPLDAARLKKPGLAAKPASGSQPSGA